MWSEGVDDGIHIWYFHSGAEHGMRRGDDMRERCLGPEPPCSKTFGYYPTHTAKHRVTPGIIIIIIRTLLKRKKKEAYKTIYKKIQYKNLDKQNTKMRRSLATAILLNLKEKKKRNN
jgi:hypothetical protein